MRVLVFDRTQKALTKAWSAGSVLYRGLRRIDVSKGVASWDEAFAFLREVEGPIEELQYWGHGKWGEARADAQILSARSLSRHHAHREQLDALKAKLAPGALVWFRCCETFGAAPGIAFAEQLSEHLGVRVAGHTYVIGFNQSGLHGLGPGARATWDPAEGLAEGTPESPVRSHPSRPWAPHTITCLQGRVPEAWFAYS